jgi:thioredoxin
MFRRRSRRAGSSSVETPSHRRAGAAANGDDRWPAPIVMVTDANFFNTTAGGYTLVDFWAPWCAPCRSFAPVFEAAARKHGDRLRFGSCNVDENRRTASLLGVTSIPTLVVFGPDGSEVTRHAGMLTPRALEQLSRDLP